MSDTLKLDFLIKIQEKIDARIMRERALIFLSILAFIFMFWNFAIQTSIDKKAQETRNSLDTLATQRSMFQTQIMAATQALMNDPDKQKKEQIAQLETDIGGVEAQLESVSQNLIKADRLPQALQEVLQKTQQLTLVEVNTLPAHELQFIEVASANSAQQTHATEEASAGVYQHTVELRVSGSFSQIVSFLIALEQLPWRFYWQSLDYSVDHYPNAEVKLRVYTLSSDEGLFGV